MPESWAHGSSRMRAEFNGHVSSSVFDTPEPGVNGEAFIARACAGRANRRHRSAEAQTHFVLQRFMVRKRRGKERQIAPEESWQSVRQLAKGTAVTIHGVPHGFL